jgi:hypothetical protein
MNPLPRLRGSRARAPSSHYRASSHPQHCACQHPARALSTPVLSRFPIPQPPSASTSQPMVFSMSKNAYAYVWAPKQSRAAPPPPRETLSPLLPPWKKQASRLVRLRATQLLAHAGLQDASNYASHSTPYPNQFVCMGPKNNNTLYTPPPPASPSRAPVRSAELFGAKNSDFTTYAHHRACHGEEGEQRWSQEGHGFQMLSLAFLCPDQKKMLAACQRLTRNHVAPLAPRPKGTGCA